MHVLRVWLKSGQVIEMMWNEKAAADDALMMIDTVPDEDGSEILFTALVINDDHGRQWRIEPNEIAAYSLADWEKELEGRAEVTRRQQLFAERMQREAAARHGMIGSGPMLRPDGNGGILLGG